MSSAAFVECLIELMTVLITVLSLPDCSITRHFKVQSAVLDDITFVYLFLLMITFLSDKQMEN